MVDDNGFKLGRSTASTVAAAASGQVSPKSQEDTAQRNATNDSLRQAGRGDVQMPNDQTTPKARPTGMADIPARTLQNRPSAGPITPHSTATPSHEPHVQQKGGQQAPTHDAQEKLLQQGRDAARGLAQLQGGGVSRPSIPVPQAPVTVNAAFHKALATMVPGSSATTSTPTRTATPPATKDAVLAKSQAEAQGTRSGDAGEAAAKSQVIAQRTPSPLLTEKGARREEERSKIATDGPTAKALANVVTGRGVSAIATAQEFSSGSNGGFGDPNGESSGLSGKVGSVAFPCVYGEQDHVESKFLCDAIALSGIAGGGEPMEKRIRHSIGDRIANSRDDTPLFDRVIGSAENHKQIAEGGRGSPYGLGKIFG